MMAKTRTARGHRQIGGLARAGALAALLMLSATAACSSPEQRVAKYTKSGQTYLEEDDLGRANVQFQNALKINEDHVPALEGLAEIAEQKQDFRSMFGVLQRIIRIDPNNAGAQVDIGKLYLIGSDETAALEAAEKALALEPKNSEALALKGAVLLKLDDTAGAVDLARQSLELAPGNAEAVTILVTERARAGDNEGALAELDKALEADADRPILHLLRLQILSNMGRTDEMFAGHERLLELYPEVVAYRQLYVGSLVRAERYKEAKEQLEEIVRLSPGKVEPILDVVRIDYRLNGSEAATQTFQKYASAAPDNTDLQVQFGNFLRQQRDYAGAEAIYDSLIKRNDDAVAMRAKNELAALRLLQGRTDEASNIVDEILTQDSSDTDALMKRAGLKIDNGDYDSAIADLRTALNNSPDATSAKILMATAFERKGDIDFAKTQMAQAVTESKNAPGPSNMYAKLLIRNNEPARAEQALVDSLATNPGNSENLKLLAAVQLMQQKWRGAEETAKLIEGVDKEDAVAQRVLGAAYAGLGEYGGAIDALSEANARAPLGARPLGTLVASYVREGRAGEAEDMLESMIEADAANYTARLLLAQVNESEKNRDEMEQTLLDAVKADPARIEAREALYRYYVGEGRTVDAGKIINDGLKAAPGSDGMKMLKADYLLSTGKKGDAIKIYEDVLTRRPNDLLASNNYASLIGEVRDDEQSRAMALEVARTLKDSENPYFLDTYGWALYRTGDYEGAVAALEKAAATAPKMSEIHYHLGAAYLAAGNAEKGRQTLQELVKGDDPTYSQRASDLLAENAQ